MSKAQYQREWARKNKEKIARYAKKWAQANPKKASKRTEEWRKRNPIKFTISNLLSQSKHRAKLKGVEHNITAEWLQPKLERGVCEITGLPFDFSFGLGKGKLPWAPTLDRIIPELGYTKENTQVVVWMYNAAKHTYTHQEVMMLVNALLEKSRYD